MIMLTRSPERLFDLMRYADIRFKYIHVTYYIYTLYYRFILNICKSAILTVKSA